MLRNFPLLLLLWATLGILIPNGADAQLDPFEVRSSIQRAQQFLRSQQKQDGSWDVGQWRIGITSLAVLGMINSGVPVDDPSVQKGLIYLRSIPTPRLEIDAERVTYELSLMTMALCAANEPNKDQARVLTLARMIENGQLTGGPNAGSWNYRLDGGSDGGDRSNGQYAILALREAAQYGIPISRKTWERAELHWGSSQNGDGGWGYTNGPGGQRLPSSGSMTVAGIATLVITQTMLGDDTDTINCCSPNEPNESLERGIRWLSQNFAVGSNPGSGGASYLLYYLYGLERAGRLSGRRFFGEENDWYREGAEFLLRSQNRSGSWRGASRNESEDVLATCFSLLFLSKGMAPVVVSKLKFGGTAEDDIPEDLWNRHPRDVHHLMDFVSGRKDWPKLLTWQVLELPKLEEETALSVLGQSPVLYLTSDRAPLLTNDQIRWLRGALDQGGTLLLSAACDSMEFREEVTTLVKQLYPEAPGLFRKLEADHPLFRSEFLLTPEAHELYGIDFGCRTPVIFSPKDVGCYWDRWSKITPPGRSAATQQQIEKRMQLGANILAYVTGREPPDKLESEEKAKQNEKRENIERGFLQIAQLRHEGGWNTAPLALRNLLTALDRQTGAVSQTRKDYVPSDKNIFNFPLLYMHGRQEFSFSESDRKQLVRYLENGGVLFADACCGSPAFDRAFRKELEKLFPKESLVRIGIEHEIFSYPFDIRQVTRRLPSVNQPDQPLENIAQKGRPFLEGIKIDGRFAVIYSKYDLSCALEKQVSLICNGYEAEDALKIALNIVIYSMLQDVGLIGEAARETRKRTQRR